MPRMHPQQLITIYVSDPAHHATCVRELIAAIHESLTHHNQHLRILTWTASAESLSAEVANCKDALDAPH